MIPFILLHTSQVCPSSAAGSAQRQSQYLILDIKGKGLNLGSISICFNQHLQVSVLDLIQMVMLQLCVLATRIQW